MDGSKAVAMPGEVARGPWLQRGRKVHSVMWYLKAMWRQEHVTEHREEEVA